MTVVPEESPTPKHRVRVWFGTHPIAEYVANAALAGRYEVAMRRRFTSLRVTNEVLPPPPAATVGP